MPLAIKSWSNYSGSLTKRPIWPELFDAFWFRVFWTPKISEKIRLVKYYSSWPDLSDLSLAWKTSCCLSSWRSHGTGIWTPKIFHFFQTWTSHVGKYTYSSHGFSWESENGDHKVYWRQQTHLSLDCGSWLMFYVVYWSLRMGTKIRQKCEDAHSTSVSTLTEWICCKFLQVILWCLYYMYMI